jgi:hypothetical protein
MLRYLIRRNASYFNLTNETIEDNYTDAAEFNVSNYNMTFDDDDDINTWFNWFVSWLY